MENTSCFNWVIRNNFPEADFWLINKGSKHKLGEPVKEFQPFLTGVKCPALILPDYGFHLCQYLHFQKLWENYSIGSINLQHLRIQDIKEVFQSIGDQHRIQDKARFKSFVPSPVAADRQELYASL